jgi:hypothetical protein
MIQELIGWVGEPSNEGFHARKAVLRDEAAARIVRAMAWMQGV